ncbi:unnamed protein product [Closterium sp. Yama58-4]|nr:unnamed protein product [Closterium sp. Yama58-4]
MLTEIMSACSPVTTRLPLRLGILAEAMALPFIRELPEHVSRKVRSSVVVPSLSQLTEELVCNSLDAGAREVSVTVDSSAVTIRVDDDGTAGPTTLGFRGEALFSIMGLSLVEIVTRPKGSASTYCKICKGGRTLSVGMTKKLRTTGTTVIVQDIFFNQPVRRQLVEKNLSKEIQSIRDRVGHLAFMYPQVSFMVSDVARSKTLLSLSGGRSVGSGIKDVFGATIFESMKEIDYQKGDLRLSGFISRLVQHESSRDVQYLYINKRLVKHTRFHKLMNSIFSTSLSLHSEAEGGAELTTFQELMFVVNLSCPRSSYDITFEPTKTYVEFKNWKSVLEFLQEVLRAVWPSSKSPLPESGPMMQPRKKKSQKSWQKIDPSYRPSHPITLSSKLSKHTHPTSHLLLLEESGETSPEDCPGSTYKVDRFDSPVNLCSRALQAKRTKKESRREDNTDQARASALQLDLNNSSECIPQPFSHHDSYPELSPFASARDSCLPPTVAIGSRPTEDYSTDLPASSQPDWTLDLQLQPDGMDLETSRCLFGRTGHNDQQPLEPMPKRRKQASPEENRHSEGYGPSHWSSIIHPEVVPDDLMLAGMEHLQDIQLQIPMNEYRTSKSASSKIAPDFPAVGSLEFQQAVEFIDPLIETQMDPSSNLEQSNKQKAWGLVACGEETGSKQKHACALPMAEKTAGPVECREESDPAPTHMAIVETHYADEVAGCCCSSKWRDGHAPACTDKNHLGSTKSVKEMYQHWSKTNLAEKEEVEPEILDLQTLASRSMQFDNHRRQRRPLIPTSVSKETLLQAKCLKQVDGKFLIATSGSTVVAIDQHAADERVCLEELRKEVLENQSAVVPLLLDTPSDLPITAGQEGCVRSYQMQIERWGWRFKLSTTGDAENSFRHRSTQMGADAMAMLSQSRRPGKSQCTPSRLIVLAVPHLLGTSLCAEDILDYLLQLQETGGLASTPPRAVVQLLASKACRGAIMFGDMLKPSESSQLIECLKHTQLPFQCAHGRPTMVPLVDLDELKRLVEGIKLQGI